MGNCFPSAVRNDGDSTSLDSIPMVVFAPAMRVPSHPIDFSKALHVGQLSCPPRPILDDLSSSHSRIMALALALAEDAANLFSKAKSRRKSATQNGATNASDLRQALEDYLQQLLAFLKEGGGEASFAVPFSWRNQEDTKLETTISDSYYEVLSVLHFMAILQLMQANFLLLPNFSSNYAISTEEKRKEAIDIFLKVSGILDFAIKIILPKLSQEARENLPSDLKEGLLYALSMQALGQSVEIQLGLAIDNVKATLAVKRRLACEQVKYWQKALESLANVDVRGAWGAKHCLFITWKLTEAKAAAFYFHGLILDEGNEDGTHAKAILCLRSAEACLKESQKLCTSFCTATPATRPPPIWGAMKYLTEKIPHEYSSRARYYRDMYRREKVPDHAPELPDFSLSLHPAEFKLPGI